MAFFTFVGLLVIAFIAFMVVTAVFGDLIAQLADDTKDERFYRWIVACVIFSLTLTFVTMGELGMLNL